MKRGKKVILFSSISFLIMTITILVWRKQYQCIDSVRKVNNLLEKNGFRKTCDKLKLKSLSDCNKYDKEMLKRHSSSNLKRELDHCPSYINNTKVSFHPEEKNYPLSFSILAHKDAVQFSRLLSAIYRPWNFYCIQVDSKSSVEFVSIVRRIIDCYNSDKTESEAGVFLSSLSLSLVWRHSSLLEGDLACLSQLLNRSPHWKYYINVVGSEFPIMTNFQLIERLKQVKNDIGYVDVVKPWPEVQTRWKYSYRLPKHRESSGYYTYGPEVTDTLKSPPPFNLTVLYGIKNVGITRNFASFVINSAVARGLRAWLSDVLVAVEHFYSTLATVDWQSNTQTYQHLQDLNKFKMRKTFWAGNYSDCHGEVRREICNLAFGDLGAVIAAESFVVNKFDTELDSTVVDCLRSMVYAN